MPSGNESHIIVRLKAEAVGDDTEEFFVPPGHYFVLGDNRDNAFDNRFTSGFVPKSDIVAKVRMIWFSLTPGNRDARLKGFADLEYP